MSDNTCCNSSHPDGPASPKATSISSSSMSSKISVSDTFNPSSTVASPKSSSLLSAQKVMSSPPDSLRRLMTTRTFPIDFDQFKKRAEAKLASVDQPSAFDLYGYGYGFGADEENSPKQQDVEGVKRRRFQRRNSKTPAMLMMSMNPLLFDLDSIEDKKECVRSSTDNNAPIPTTPNRQSSLKSTIALSPRLDPRVNNFDVWDGGLEIAEDLVMHLQKRKKPSKA